MKPPQTNDSVALALAAADVAALQILAASADKGTRKAAKHALHLLRSRGLAIPEAPAPAPSATALAAGEEAREPVLASTYDSSGDRAIFLPLKAKLGFTLHLLVLSSERGVVSLESSELSRKQVRATISELPSQTRELLREISPARAAALIAQALALAPDAPSAGRAREVLRALPPQAPVQAPAAVDAASDEAALRESARLYETSAFQSDSPPREVLLQVAQQLEEVLVSPLLVDESQRRAQMRHALDRAIAEFFTPARRESSAVRLLDSAELFDERGNPAAAAQARAAGAALRSDRPIHEIPFARILFEDIFDLEAAAKSEAAPGAAEPSTGGGQGSGLILPP